MDIKELNKLLLEVFAEYEKKAKELQKVEFAYEERYNHLYLNSGMGTLPMKDAEAKSILAEEGIYERLIDLRSDVKILYYKQNMLQEYGRNVRITMPRPIAEPTE